MASSTKKTLQTIVFACVGIGLMWLVLRDTDFPRLWQILQTTKWGWLILGLFLNTMSNVVRAARWNMLIEPLGYKPRLIVSWFAVQIAYGANLIFPRLGEVSRCAVLLEYEDVPVDKSLGTVVTERLADLVMLALIVPLALLLDYNVFIRFLNQLNWGKTQNLLMLLTIAFVACVFGLLLTVYLFKKYKNNKIIIKIKDFIKGVKIGLYTILKLKNPFLFIFHTLLMWVLYWLTSYFIFRCFGFSEHLTLISALVLLATGTFGFVVPVNGGIGAYEAIAIATLSLYGLDGEQAKAYALINHFGTIVLQATIGVLAVVLLAAFFKKKKLVVSS